MPAWDCPDCGRRFARRGQSHECEPALSLQEYFSTGPERERPIFEAVHAHLETLGPLVVEPLSVGIYFKRSQTFAILRPMQRWVALGMLLPHRVQHPTVTRKPERAGAGYYDVCNLRSADDVDDSILGWLAEAYHYRP